MSGQLNRNSRKHPRRNDHKDSYDSMKYSRRRIHRSSSSRSSSPMWRRGHSSSSGERYRDSRKLYHRPKRYFDDCGVVFLFLPISTTEVEINDIFGNFQTLCKNIEFKHNNDGVTMHAFANLGSSTICKQFISRTLTSVVTLSKCRVKVLTENEYHSQIYMGHHLYETPELPTTLQSDSLAKNLVENPPCNVLIFKSLDYSATEEQVRESVTTLTSDILYDVRVIKDKSTGLSRGFCFVEMGSIADATKLLNIIIHKTLSYTICNRRILAGYARMNTYNSNGISSLLPTTVDTFTIERSVYTSRVANDAIAAAQINNSTNICQSNSSMTLDTQSGYYYDSNTGLYYDPNSGYYYDPNNFTYMYYDQNLSQWIVIPNTVGNKETIHESEIGCAQPNLKITKTSSEIVQSTNHIDTNDPKQIAKEMEKWAKKQNINKKLKYSNENITNSIQSSLAFHQVDLAIKNENINSDPFILWDKLLCLLCVRKFKSGDILRKHAQFSQLHKDNVTLFNARTIVSLGEKSKKNLT